MHNPSIVHRRVMRNGKKILWWVAWSCSLLWLKNLIRVSDLHQTLQQQSIRHLCADITVFTGAVALQEILALPSIIFDLHRGHTIEPFFAFSLSPNRLKPRVP